MNEEVNHDTTDEAGEMKLGVGMWYGNKDKHGVTWRYASVSNF